MANIAAYDLNKLQPEGNPTDERANVPPLSNISGMTQAQKSKRNQAVSSVGGADTFRELYERVVHPGVPSGANTQDQVMAAMNIRKRPEVDPENPAPVHAILPLTENVWNDEEEEAWHDIVEESNALRQAAALRDWDVIINAIKHLPPGYRLNLGLSQFDLSLSGWFVGELVRAIRNASPALLSGLYLSGTLRMFCPRQDIGFTYDFAAVRIPLNQIAPVWDLTPYSQEAEGQTMNDLLEDLMGEEGSLNHMFIIGQDTEIVRLNSSPAFLVNRLGPVVTGSFSDLLHNTTCIPQVKLGCGWFGSEPCNFDVIVPGGSLNCIVEATGEFILKALIDGKGNVSRQPGSSQDYLNNMYKKMVEVWKARALSLTKDLYISTKLSKMKRQPTEKDKKALILRFKKATRLGFTSQIYGLFKKTVFINSFDLVGLKPDVHLHFEREHITKGRVRLTLDEVIPSVNYSSHNQDPYYLPVFLVRVTADGNLFKVDRDDSKKRTRDEEDDDDDLSDEEEEIDETDRPAKRIRKKSYRDPSTFEGESRDIHRVLHAVAIYPPFPPRLMSNTKYRAVFKTDLANVLVPLFTKSKELGRGIINDGFTALDLERQVDYQNERIKSGESKPTLIYETRLNNEDNYKVNTATQCVVSDSFKKTKQYKAWLHSSKEYVAVFAGDLETVSKNSDGSIPVLTPEFILNHDAFANIPVESRELISPVNTGVVPYLAVLQMVNLSCEGVHRQKKIESGIPIRDEDVYFPGCMEYLECTNGMKMRTGYIVNGPPKLFNGGKVLGQCVNDMIADAFQSIIIGHKHRVTGEQIRYKSGVIFFHNGTRFDIPVILGFLNLADVKVKDVLQTGKGVLSATLKFSFVPEGENTGKSIKLVLMDTMNFLSGSLASIAKDLGCPLAWRKVETFPIQRVTANLCYHPVIYDKIASYTLNDAYALSFIVKRLNQMLSRDPEPVVIPGNIEYIDGVGGYAPSTTSYELTENQMKIRDIHIVSPWSEPVFSFITLMSAVKSFLKKAFETLNLPKVYAIDVPFLRALSRKAVIGGRTIDAFKMSAHSNIVDVFKAYTAGDMNYLVSIHSKIKASGEYITPYDANSLYPTVMQEGYYPHGHMRYLSKEECLSDINAARVKYVTSGVAASNSPTPFSIILVKDLRKSRVKCSEAFWARKTKKGLIYSLEDTPSLAERIGEDNVYYDGNMGVYAYTNTDLAFMMDSFSFTIIGGFGWKTSQLFKDVIGPTYELRKIAKKSGYFAEQWMLKIFLNGFYGVHCQSDIDTTFIVIELPAHLRYASPDNMRLINWLRANTKELPPDVYVVENIPLLCGSNIIKCKIYDDLAESRGKLSPTSVAAQVLALARAQMEYIMRNVGYYYYMDTDSIYVKHKDVLRSPIVKALIHNELGGIKDDYEDSYGDKDGVCILLISVAKKVKLCIALLNNGELAFKVSFKGYCGQSGDGKDRRYSYKKKESEMVATIVHIFYHGAPPERTETRWRRTMNSVNIADSATLGKMETYFGNYSGAEFYRDSDGFYCIRNLAFGCDRLYEDSKFIKFGESFDLDEWRKNIIIPEELFKSLINKYYGFDAFGEGHPDAQLAQPNESADMVYDMFQSNVYYTPNFSEDPATREEEKKEWEESNNFFDNFEEGLFYDVIDPSDSFFDFLE